jgi:hypothetical protein
VGLFKEKMRKCEDKVAASNPTVIYEASLSCAFRSLTAMCGGWIWNAK